MKVRIDINENFAQILLQDDDFRSNLELVWDGNHIAELWLKNNVIDNDEATFRAQALEMVKLNYCRIAEINPEYLDLSYEGVLPMEVRFVGAEYRLGYLVKIIDFENE